MNNTVRKRHSAVKPLETLTFQEVASRIGIGINQAREAACRGDFPAMRIGRRWIIPREAFDNWLRTAGGKYKADDHEKRPVA